MHINIIISNTIYFLFLGEQVQKLYRTFLHIVYILVAMIVAAFLQAPFLTRATIIGLIPVNLITYLKHGLEASLDFTSMTVLIFLITGSKYYMNSFSLLFSYTCPILGVESVTQSTVLQWHIFINYIKIIYTNKLESKAIL